MVACAAPGTVSLVTRVHAARRPAPVLQLDDRHLSEVYSLLDDDPLINAVLASRLLAAPTLTEALAGGSLLGIHDGTVLRAATYSGGNLLPVGGGEPEWRELAGLLSGRRRMCTSIVGPADAVHTMWDVLEPAWGPARAVRARQPLLAIGAEGPRVTGDPAVRPVLESELELYLPAAVAMFTEELGVSPLASVSLAAYRRRVAGLIQARRAFAAFDRHGTVVFKADIGAVSRHTCQLQGVWVRPELRGRGLGTAALATVINFALQLAPTVSLYVNDYNERARRVYRRLGMYEVATLATVLF
jgi:predicted GNAT family acetyltransferase